MARTRENGVKVWSAADAQSEGVAAFMGLPEDSTGGYAGGDSTADAINNVKGTAESAYQTIDTMTATAHPLPAGVDPTVTVTGDMGAKVINVGIPESTTPPEPASFRALAPVRVALADDDVRVVAIGDSNTEGAGVSSRSDRWFEQVVASLRQRVPSGSDTGIGWVPAVSLGGPAGFSWTGGEETSDHVGGKGRVLSGSAVGTFTAAGDVTVMWKGGSGGSFTVKIGSGSAQTVDASTGTGTQQQTFTATGSNTVTITGTSGAPVFYGAHFQTDADGVHGWNLGQSGSRTDTWAYGDPQWGAPDSEVPAMQALGLIKPHLVVIALGANGLGGIFGQDYPPKQYAADMAALVANVRSHVEAGGGTPPGFLLITPSQLVDNMGTSRDSYWLAFERELRREFQGDALVSILHESDVWQPVSKTNPDPAGYLADTIHWSAAGMAAVGDYVKTWLARGFADAPEAAQAVVTAQQAVAASQQSATDAQQAATEASDAVTLAQQAQAASLEVPDANVTALLGNPVTDTAQALTTFQDQRSRAAALTAAAAPPMRWWVLRRSPDTYAIVAAMPSGLYWSWDLMRDNNNPGGFRTCITGNYSCIGVPMRYVPYQSGTYTGGTWARFSSLLGTSDLPLPGLLPGEIDIQVSTTAGDRNIDPVNYPGTFPDRVGHAIVVYGAGEGGGDLVTQISNVTSQGRIVLKSSPLPALTGNFDAKVWPGYILSASNDATATATYTTPATATRVGVSCTPSVGGGIWSVTLDGSATEANMCPTGQDMLDAGYVSAADMVAGGGPIDPTKRYIDFHYSQPSTHRPIGLARDLAAGVHTVTLASTGVKHAGGGSNVRALISGWAWGTDADTPDDDGVSIYGQHWVIPEESAIEFAHEIAPATGGTPTFVGSQHGWEDQTRPLDVLVDGAPFDLAVGEGVGGTLVTVTRTSQLHHPDATGPVADVTYEWSAGTGMPLRVSHRITWLQDVTVTNGYPVHCNTDAATLTRGMTDTTGTVLVWDQDDAFQGVGRSRAIGLWGPRVLFVENVPAVETVTGGWSSNANILHCVRDRSAGPGRRWAKTYLSRQGSPQTGHVWRGEAEYRVALTFGDFTPPA